MVTVTQDAAIPFFMFCLLQSNINLLLTLSVYNQVKKL